MDKSKLDELTLHITWANEITQDFRLKIEDSELYKSMIALNVDWKDIFLPTEFIPIMGVIMNVMFQDEELGEQLCQLYEIHPALVRTMKVYVFG